MNKDFYELHSAQYEENARVLETLALADKLGVSYEDAEAFIADMATNPYGLITIGVIFLRLNWKRFHTVTL